MNAPNHWKTALGLGLGGGAALVLAGIKPVAALGCAAVVALASLGPDLDKPPEGGHPGATAAESHGLISNGIAGLVAMISGGHRCRRHWWSTHRYTCAMFMGLVVALAVEWFGPWPAFVLVAWWGAWPLYCQMSHQSRWSACLISLAVALVALERGWLPVTPWLGAAVAVGWAAHIACDHLQSAMFENGGTAETCIAWSTMAAGALLFARIVV